MAKRKMIVIDGELREVDARSAVVDVVPKEVQSIVTWDGGLISRSEFERIPVPEGFETNLSVINKGGEIGRATCRSCGKVYRVFWSGGEVWIERDGLRLRANRWGPGARDAASAMVIAQASLVEHCPGRA